MEYCALPAELPAITLQLASDSTAPPSGPEWVHEIKYDGYRAQIRISGSDIRILTRKGINWTHRFPALAEDARDLGVSTALLDREVVAERETGWESFNALQEALSHGRSDELAYRSFDLLWLDGIDLRNLPLQERKERLKAVLEGHEGSRIRYSDHVEASGDDVLKHACAMGLEGIVSKRLDSSYRGRVSRTWLKTKCAQRDEFIIGGFIASKGNVRSLLLGTPKADQLQFVGKVGSGLTDSLSRRHYEELSAAEQSESPFVEEIAGARFTEPRLVAEMEYRGRSANSMLRHPVFKGIRDEVRTSGGAA